jgi:hypothetical protein
LSENAAQLSGRRSAPAGLLRAGGLRIVFMDWFSALFAFSG